ncbi:L-proline dehydrogenase [Leifsonia sp. 98AMF]|uniref:proline dehydrogenase family protein n=1 Tax=unclassified Leifsonia TaxID=2663824 RepID=UPI00087C504B|nr:MULTISPECIES: bifunctional proline dehydrogenase/L-glutamate gamma-semialdehyde dehydrogenase [unclassified Leifsonia]SDH02466.1 L-proline dehydrogenase [Leifsonia sp. 197AMF]SDJ38932.1 L-proline dehydrogenase [Leifsonia sp. 466MF]SDK39829.1 L-proline dehydrogenase [Leifsonia sp. 157MF]SDN59165.1 L-proline dehydrogenase [Leifsonia sp. 509MF]SEN50126.1 L-proline dehydrogenase [Leifsonia sp. 467MF]
MVDTTDGAEARPATIAHEAVELVQRWLAESARGDDGSAPRQDPAAERLAGVLSDPHGLDFAVGFVDGVARPQDLFVAGYNLQRVAKRIPAFLPWYMRFAIWLGGVFGPVLPWVVIPIARRVLRRMVGHLVVDATPEKLGPAIARLRSPDDPDGHGARLNLNLLGEAVLGEKEALRRLEGTRTLLARDDVDYVSIKVSSIASQLSMWAFDETVERVVERLSPLYEFAAASPTPKFINLDMEEYRDLDLTMAVFTSILSKPQLLGLEAGIVLQAYLPDALDALQTLTEWSTQRRAQGGAPIKIRVVKGANLAMERVDATIHGWPLATYGTKQSTDANYKRVLDWALTPEHTDAVKIGIAGHNLFDIAYAWLLAQKRGVTARIDFEMLLGMATAQAEAVKRTVGELLLYTPVVDPREFDVAISYLIRRLEENASTENFMSAVFQLGSDPELFEREKQRFLASVAEFESDSGPRGTAPVPNRQQDRAREWEEASAPSFTRPPAPPAPAVPATPEEQGLTSVVLGLTRGSGGIELTPPDEAAAPGTAAAVVPSAEADDFRNAPDTDPSRATNRAWGKRILARSATSSLGAETIAGAAVRDAGRLDVILGMVAEAGREWGARSGHDRAAILDRAGHALEANRDRLIEVMAAETGKTIAEADPEVSEAADFAHYYATRARELDAVQGAQFVPSALTVVAPPWNFPVAIPAGSVLAALAAGSGVIIKPAPQARRSAAVMVEALWESGIPRHLLALVDVAENELGQQLIADRRVDRVILTGSYETAKLFRSWRPDLPLLAETSGKNAIIVTPSADYDLAVSDIVKSAFGHAGQKCSAASLVILVGSVAKSERFRNQLVDAVVSLRVGYPQDAVSQMGPLIEPASGKLLHALTTLGAEEEWLVEPRRLDDTGRLWTPGVRTGVQPGSYFHLTEFFGPVLGIMTARDLDEAIRYQNAVEYGLTAGLHSLDRDELVHWLDTVEAGNLYVNRGITGAIVRRQPFGGWKRSSVGAGTKAGGPNYLLGLGSWIPEAGHSSSSLHLRGLETRVSDLIESGQSSMDYPSFDLVRRSALSDAIAVATEYHRVKDVSGLGVERNLFRYRPVPVAIRLSEGSSLPELLRVMAAGTVARSPFSVSTPVKLPRGMHALLREREIEVVVESDAHWLSRIRAHRVPAHRIRLIGGDPVALATALGGSPDVAVYSGPVTPSGRVEVLTFLHEQAISITNHRFGNPTHLSDDIL